MAGTADVLAGLRDIRLPAESTQDLAADALAAFAVGIAAALVLALLARLVTHQRERLRRTSLADLSRTRSLPAGARLFAQAQLLARVRAGLETAHGPSAARDRRILADFLSGETARGLHEALYQARPELDPTTVERDLGRVLARLRS